MDVDALLHPRGPLPPGVYWRRRAVTLLAVVLAGVLLTRACGADGEPRTTLSPSPSPTTTASRPPRTPAPSPTASPLPTAVGRCRPSNLVVNARADDDLYPAGRRPVLTIGVRNTGSAPCTFDVGQANREIRVTSGNDRIWSSDDCSPGGAAQLATLRPGAAPTEFSVTWSRKRSAPGCPAGLRDAAPGTYRVTGRFGELVGEPDTFSLR